MKKRLLASGLLSLTISPNVWAAEIDGPCTRLRTKTFTEWADCMNKHLGEQQAQIAVLAAANQNQQLRIAELETENQKLRRAMQTHSFSTYADDTCLPPDAGSKSPLLVFQCFEAKLNRQQKRIA